MPKPMDSLSTLANRCGSANRDGRQKGSDAAKAEPSFENLTIFLKELVSGGKQVNRPTLYPRHF